MSRTEKPVFAMVPKDMTRGGEKESETRRGKKFQDVSAMIQPLQPVKEEQTSEGLGP